MPFHKNLLQQFSCLTAAFRILIRSRRLEELFPRNPDASAPISLEHIPEDRVNGDENNNVYISYQDLIRLRLWPYGTYRTTFRYCWCIGNHEMKWTTKKRIVFVVPSKRITPGIVKVSKNLWFNTCGCVSNKQLEIVKFEYASRVDVAKLAHISVIKSPDYPSDLKLESHQEILDFFKVPRLFYDNDVFSVPLEITSDFEIVYFKVSTHESPCLVHQSTSLYQRTSQTSPFPGQRIDSETDFLPQTMQRVIQKMERIIESVLEPNIAPLNPSPVVLVLAGSSLPLLLKRLADQLCINMVEVDCYDFWSLDGRVPDKAISEAIERAKKYSPCLFIFDGISVLEEDSQSRLETGNRTLELLRNSIQTLPSNVIVIFTCQTIELPDLPKTIAEMVHFEFIVESLAEEDRIDFAKFMFRRLKVDEDVHLSWFANNTRGFLLSELNQLVDIARAKAVSDGRNSITKEDIQYGIEKRNKSFGDIVGVPKIPSIKWEDVGGMEDVKKIITESLKMNMKRKGLKRSGIVLYGPPGCGKTLIAKAVANEFDITFLSVKGPELLNQYVGQSEHNLRMIFEKARLASPSILFFDELDSLAPNRGVAGDSGGVMDRIVSQLLTELDTLHSKINCEVFVMAATNRPDLLDPCLLTPGRFDKVVYVKPATDLESKIRILKASTRKMNLAKDVTVERIAERCPELMSGADLSSLMSKASMYALKQTITRIEQRLEDVKTAKIEITMQHVNLALEEFSGSLNQSDVERYSRMENIF